MSTNNLFMQASGKKDIKKIIYSYLRFWYFLLLGGILGIVGAYVYLNYYNVPQYYVYSTVLIKDDKAGALTNASAFKDLDMFNSSKNIDNEIEVLQSKRLMERVIHELGLATGYYLEGRMQDIEVYGNSLPVTISFDSLQATAIGSTMIITLKSEDQYELNDFTGQTETFKFGQKVKRAYGSFTVAKSTAFRLEEYSRILVRLHDVEQLAEYYSQAIEVGAVNKSASVIWVGLTDPSPQKAKDIVNKLVEVYGKEAIEDKNLIATNTIEFIDERLKFLTAELTGVEKVVEQFKQENQLTDVNTQASNYLSQASGYNQQLTNWAIQIEVLESIEQYINNADNHHKMVPSTLTIEDPTLMELITKFNEIQLNRERILRTAQAKSPIILNMDEQLADLRASISENLRNIKKGLLITSNSLKENSGEFESKIKKVPSMERELLEIGRQQAIKQNLYLYLLQKREETALSLAASVSNSRVIDPARGGRVPVTPNKSTFYIMSALLGFCLPFGCIYLKNLLYDKVQTRDDLLQLTGTPILGELAEHKDEVFVVTEGKRSQIVEMFRLIRAKLQLSAIDKKNKVILVTSSVSGEGKTFFALNFAASLVLTGKKVLLIDLDLRSSSLEGVLNLSKGAGLSDYIVSDQLSIDEIIRYPEKMPELAFISSGPVPLNPAEMIMSSRLAELIVDLRGYFDYIILDSSPVGQVADALSLSPIIDSTIYIVRCDYTNKKQIGIIEEIFQTKLLPRPMIVLNSSKDVGSYVYGYGYGIHHQASVVE